MFQKKMLLIGVLALNSMSGLYAQSMGAYNPAFDRMSGTKVAPPQIQDLESVFCSAYVNDKGPAGVFGHGYSACRFGLSMARNIAIKYVGARAGYFGCINGWSEGFRGGVIAGRGAQGLPISDFSRTEMVSAKSTGRNQAVIDAKSINTDVIIKAYRDVLNSNMAPNPIKKSTAPTFQGVDNGYAIDFPNKAKPANGESFELGVVRAYQYAQHKDGCSAEQDAQVFGMDQWVQWTYFDYFKDLAKSRFTAQGFNDGAWAYYVATKYEKLLVEAEADNYFRLARKDGFETKIVKVPKKDPVSGAVIPGQFDDVEAQVPAQVKLDDADRAKFYEILRLAFVDSYERNYAAQVFYNAYIDKFSNAKDLAFAKGEALGRHVETEVRNSIAYNSKYKTDSKAEYSRFFETELENNFVALKKNFEEYPVYELNNVEIYGADETDEISRAGENLGVLFSASNLGRKSGTNTLYVTGNNVTQEGTFSFTLDKSTRADNINTGLITTISNVDVDTVVNLNFAVNNNEKLSSILTGGLKVKANGSLVVNDFAEIRSANATVDYLNGTVTMVVGVSNPANTSPSSIVYDLVSSNTMIGGSEIKVASMTLPSRNDRNTVSLTRTNIDPMKLITLEKTTEKLSSVIAGRRVQTVQVSANLPVSKREAIGKYFTSLASGQSNNSGVESKEARMTSLIRLIADEVDQDIRNEIKWTSSSSYQNSVLYALSNNYKAVKLNAEGQAYFDQLIEALAPKCVKLKSEGILNDGKNRNEFLDYLRPMSKKVKKNWRKYK